MTNPNDAVGTNAAYGTRTSVNAFNDFAQLVNGRGVLSGWDVLPKSGMVLNVGGVAGTRDVAVAEDNLGNRTTVNNRSNSPIEVEIGAAAVSSNRYDAIVVYVNNPAQAVNADPDAPDPDAPSVCGIIVAQGGTTGVSEAQIRAAISADGGTGSVAYYAVLATVFVAAGATSITGANITQQHIAISASDIADNEITGAMIQTDASWINISSSSSWTCKCKKSGNVVTVVGDSAGGNIQANTYVTVGTLPSGYRPTITMYNPFTVKGGNQGTVLRANTDGTVELYSSSSDTAYWGFTLTFVV